MARPCAPAPRPKARARGFALSALLLSVLVLAACGPGLPSPASKQADDTANLWRIALGAAALVGGVTMALILTAAFRFRRRDDSLPGQRASHTVLEVVCTAVPVAIVAGLFAFTVNTERKVTRVVPDPGLVVNVVAYQWGWTFTYPDDGVVSSSPEAGEPAVLALPVGTTVRFNLRASDVIHSFWVPQFLEKRDVIPGFPNTIDVTVTRPGTWTGRCAEFCGLNHWEMNFEVRAMPKDDFQAWLADHRSTGDPPAAATTPVTTTAADATTTPLMGPSP